MSSVRIRQGVFKLNLNIFSERLRSLRLKQKGTLQKVGDAVGCNRQAIGNFENARKSPSLDMIIALADYFDVSLDYLVGRSDDPARH
jgi:transcriptional regulator with XRE-family HTH domain